MASNKNTQAEGIDLPLGLGMGFSANPKAAEHFYALPRAEQAATIAYIQSATSGKDAKAKVKSAISNLSAGTAPY